MPSLSQSTTRDVEGIPYKPNPKDFCPSPLTHQVLVVIILNKGENPVHTTNKVQTTMLQSEIIYSLRVVLRLQQPQRVNLAKCAKLIGCTEEDVYIALHVLESDGEIVIELPKSISIKMAGTEQVSHRTEVQVDPEYSDRLVSTTNDTDTTAEADVTDAEDEPWGVEVSNDAYNEEFGNANNFAYGAHNEDW